MGAIALLFFRQIPSETVLETKRTGRSSSCSITSTFAYVPYLLRILTTTAGDPQIELGYHLPILIGSDASANWINFPPFRVSWRKTQGAVFQMALVDLEQGILAPLIALSSRGMSEWAWSRTGKPFSPWGITESTRQADSSGQADHAASERKYWPSAPSFRETDTSASGT